MRVKSWIPALFIFVGCVEFITGSTFIFFPEWLFQRTGIEQISALEYIQFPALLIMVFGLMMLAVARDPKHNYNLIPYICLFKVSLIGVVFFNWLTKGLSWLWISFAFFDIAYLIGFLLAYKQIKILVLKSGGST